MLDSNVEHANLHFNTTSFPGSLIVLGGKIRDPGDEVDFNISIKFKIEFKDKD